jgi:uncharacterized protein (TIGR02996 family)
MTQQAAFLSDIIAHPEDDTPRLVFADWCDDHGDADRAELIRAQVELVRLPRYEPRHQELDRRARELIEANGKRWAPDLGKVRRVEYRRGFIERLTYRTSSAFLRAAGRVFDLAPVRRVEIEVPWFSFGTWKRCPHLSRLRGLMLDRFGTDKWNVEALEEVIEHPGLANLVELNLDSNFYLGTEWAEVLAGSTHLSHLRILNLMGNGIERQGVRFLGDADHLATLEALDLGGNDIGPGGLADLAAAPVFAGLTDLRLGRDEEFSDHGNDVGDRGVRALVRSRHPSRLRVLVLAGNNITNKGVAELASWPGLARLEWLDLSDNPITDAGAKALAASPDAANLRGLSFYSNEIGPKGIQALLDSPHLAGLREFAFHEEAELPDELWQAVRERFGPGLDEFGYWQPPEPA